MTRARFCVSLLLLILAFGILPASARNQDRVERTGAAYTVTATEALKWYGTHVRGSRSRAT